MEKLNLKGEIDSIEFDAFSDMKNLKELDLSHCKIREISMDALMGCRQLEILNLSHNNLKYLPPGIFDDQQKLIEIYLHNNQLTTLPTNFFLQPQLQLAHLHNNPWKCTCDMQDWLPKVTKLEKSGQTERCVTDFLTGQQILCKQVVKYDINPLYTPRCQNYDGRSVFYVLRKQLRCGSHKLVMHKKQRKFKPHWMKLQEKNKQANLTINAKGKKQKLKLEHINSLQYLMKPQKKQEMKIGEIDSKEKQEMSNEIYY